MTCNRICSVRVHSGGTGQPDLAHCSVSIVERSIRWEAYPTTHEKLDVVVCNWVRLHSIAKQSTSSESDLSGSIPAELGNLTSLTYLNLSYNSLSGEKRIFIYVASCLDFFFKLQVFLRVFWSWIELILACEATFWGKVLIKIFTLGLYGWKPCLTYLYYVHLYIYTFCN